MPRAREVSRPMIPLGASVIGFAFSSLLCRCMVGGNQVDGSICKSLYNRLTVLFGTERRIHFRKCSMLKDCVFRQCKMMRCGFGVKFCTHFLISTNQIDRDTGADMLDYNIGTGFQCQHAVSCNQRFFCNGRRTVDAKRIGYLSVADSVVADERRIFFVKADRYVKLWPPFPLRGSRILRLEVGSRHR